MTSFSLRFSQLCRMCCTAHAFAVVPLPRAVPFSARSSAKASSCCTASAARGLLLDASHRHTANASSSNVCQIGCSVLGASRVWHHNERSVRYDPFSSPSSKVMSLLSLLHCSQPGCSDLAVGLQQTCSTKSACQTAHLCCLQWLLQSRVIDHSSMFAKLARETVKHQLYK